MQPGHTNVVNPQHGKQSPKSSGTAKQKYAGNGWYQIPVNSFCSTQCFQKFFAIPCQFFCLRMHFPAKLAVQFNCFIIEIGDGSVPDDLLVISLTATILVEDDEIIFGTPLIGRANPSASSLWQRLIFEVDGLFMYSGLGNKHRDQCLFSEPFCHDFWPHRDVENRCALGGNFLLQFVRIVNADSLVHRPL